MNFQQSLLQTLGIRYILDIQSTQESPGPEKPAEIKTPEPAAEQEMPGPLIRFLRPAYSAWTYYHLPQDIDCNFAGQRWELLKKIIQGLNWSAGSYTFWPVSRMHPDGPVPDMDLFLQGLKRISPAYTFVFGKQAFEVLFRDTPYAYGPHLLKQHKIIALPALEAMLPDARLLKFLAWNLLKKYSPAGI
ncbi:MAG: hypothetical protein ACOCPN_00525 [Desulfonatronovibrionaceae bacterium]